MGLEMVQVKPKIRSLPYIEIPTSKGPIKMLIDCGANVNVISKKWALSSGIPIENIHALNIRGVTGSEKVKQGIKLNLFQPLLSENFKFLVFDFHPFFDGILGTVILFENRFNLITAEKNTRSTSVSNSLSASRKKKLSLWLSKPKLLLL